MDVDRLQKKISGIPVQVQCSHSHWYLIKLNDTEEETKLVGRSYMLFCYPYLATYSLGG